MLHICPQILLNLVHTVALYSREVAVVAGRYSKEDAVLECKARQKRNKKDFGTSIDISGDTAIDSRGILLLDAQLRVPVRRSLRVCLYFNVQCGQDLGAAKVGGQRWRDLPIRRWQLSE